MQSVGFAAVDLLQIMAAAADSFKRGSKHAVIGGAYFALYEREPALKFGAESCHLRIAVLPKRIRVINGERQLRIGGRMLQQNAELLVLFQTSYHGVRPVQFPFKLRHYAFGEALHFFHGVRVFFLGSEKQRQIPCLAHGNIFSLR